MQEYPDSIIRNQDLDLIRPFDKKPVVPRKASLETHVQGLHFILQPIKVEMVGDQFALFPPIFVDQSESGAAPSVNGPKFMDQGLDQGGLAHPHVPIETKDLGWGRPEEFPGYLLD